MKTYSFEWKNDYTTHGNQKRKKNGFIAQELDKILPETVVKQEWYIDEDSEKLRRRKTNSLGVRYSEILPVVVASIKEDQNSLNTISQQLEEIDNLLNKLKQ